jgi:hypothetical protein
LNDPGGAVAVVTVDRLLEKIAHVYASHLLFSALLPECAV